MSIFRLVADLEDSNQPGALCTVVNTAGSTPRHDASKMLVYPDGKIAGTVGGGEMENRIIKEALKSIEEGKPRFLKYSMTDPKRGDPGICGGQVEVFVEPILPRPALVLIGAGHVGKAVVALAHWLGFYVVVNDDRPEFANPEAVPYGDEYHAVPMKDLPQHFNITPWSYLVLTTRGVPIDVPGLPALLDTPAAYIGVIGSHRRWLTTRKQLLDAGVPEEKLNRVHSPTGLEINAETPEEIALSIMAEIVMLRSGGDGSSMALRTKPGKIKNKPDNP
jgi:xanthine dehydrogenase accessory factor